MIINSNLNIVINISIPKKKIRLISISNAKSILRQNGWLRCPLKISFHKQENING